jgi:hypothetical protein
MPWNKGVFAEIPIIIDEVHIGMAYPAMKNFEHHVVGAKLWKGKFLLS